MQQYYKQIKLNKFSVNLDSVRVGWLGSFLNDGKKEKDLERIPQKTVVL